MENGGYMFVREQSGNNNNGNSNSNNLAWENTWALNNHHSRFDLGSSSSSFLYRNTTAETTNATLTEGNAAHALLFPHPTHRSLYAGVGSNLHPDPHLMCLKLGKRHYFEDSTAAPMGQRHVDGAGGYSMVKKGKPYYTYSGCGDGVGLSSSSSAAAPVLVTPTATVPRCQVDGCHVALINSKEYHRRHKVCEMHSKAPKVMVLGLEQRFCQQCSRFHVVSEFDDTKRSCRRRLAGHNERRRKSSHDSLSRNSSQVNKLVSGRLRSPATGRALSLLSSSSSSKAGSWVSSSDLSSRCSAALRELIAENRAAILARHLILDGRDWNNNANHEDHPQTGSDSLTSNHHYLYHQHQIMLTEQQQQQQQQQQQNNWERYQETNTHVTLDLMQAPSEEEECSELWTSLDDDHVV